MEATPFGQRLDIVEFCSDNGIQIMCDNPLAKDLNCEHQAFLGICERLDMTPQQVRRRKLALFSVHVLVEQLVVCTHV